MTGAAPHRVTLHVLPFENLSDDGGADYFSRGFVADLASEFSRFSELAVLSGRSALTGLLPARHVAPSGRACLDGATIVPHYVLRGSLRRDGARLRVSTELLDATTDTVVWADRLEREGAGVFAIQDEICARVVSSVSMRIRTTLTAATRRKSTEAYLAYDYWLRGVDELKQGSLEADERARALFRAALEQDPAYARAYVGLSLSHFNEWSCQLWQRWDENEQHAYAYAKHAIELDQADHWCQLVLGRILLFRREFERAEQHLMRSLLLNGNDADALIQIAMSMAFLDRRELALSLFARALERNPFHDPTYYAYGLAGAFANARYEEVVRYAELVPPAAMVDLPAYAAAALFQLGEQERAGRELHNYLRQFHQKVARGRVAEPGEALRWLQHVNPFRSTEVETRLLSSLRSVRDLAGASPPAVADTPELCVFRQVGSLWQATYGGESAWLAPCKGFVDLSVLLAAPGQEVHCADLMGVVGSAADAEVFDEVARDRYTARIRTLEQSLTVQASETLASPPVAGTAPSAAHRELEALRAQLNSGVGLGGRARKLAAPGERARSAVTQRIKAAVRRIAQHHPSLGAHLQQHLKTGTFCSYDPPRSLQWQV